MAKDKTVKVVNKGGPMGFAMFLSFFGALVYFLQTSFGFWGSVLAILKAAVWPAILVYEGLKALGA